jgi:hypothetical protein
VGEEDTEGLARAGMINSVLLGEEKKCQILGTGEEKEEKREEENRKEMFVGNFTEHQLSHA